MTAQGYAPPKHCADAGSPAARSPSNRDRYRRADIHCNTRDRQKPAAGTPTPAKGRSACGRTRSLHQKKHCRTGNCREMAEQKTTAASPEKGLAAVVLAPQTGLEPAAFRLGVRRCHSVFFSTSSTVSSRFISCCTADTSNRKLSL